MFFQKVNLSCNCKILRYVWTQNQDDLYIEGTESGKIISLYRKYNIYNVDCIKLYLDTGSETYTLNFKLDSGSSYYYKSEINIELKFEMVDGREKLHVYVDGKFIT